jgi:hypothetical protein
MGQRFPNNRNAKASRFATSAFTESPGTRPRGHGTNLDYLRDVKDRVVGENGAALGPAAADVGVTGAPLGWDVCLADLEVRPRWSRFFRGDSRVNVMGGAGQWHPGHRLPSASTSIEFMRCSSEFGHQKSREGNMET